MHRLTGRFFLKSWRYLREGDPGSRLRRPFFSRPFHHEFSCMHQSSGPEGWIVDLIVVVKISLVLISLLGSKKFYYVDVSYFLTDKSHLKIYSDSYRSDSSLMEKHLILLSNCYSRWDVDRKRFWLNFKKKIYQCVKLEFNRGITHWSI